MSSRFARFTLVFSLGCVASLAAEEAAPPTKPPAYVLKNRSGFATGSDDQRAPFWPIGWSKRKPTQTASTAVRVVEAPKVVLDEKSFKVTSILLGNPSLAIINGRTYSEGEFLRTPRTAAMAATPATPGVVVAPAARVRVYRINDGNVVLQCQEQTVTITLQRPELVQRSAVEDLLTEDRP